MLELSSTEIALRLDPAHGAEVLDLVHLRSGRQLLGRPPFKPSPPRGGDLDEDAWTASYRGGWQIAAPNAGKACVVAGVRHGFHGRASVDAWELLARDEASALLRWRGHGLELTRRVKVTGRTVTARLSWTTTEGPLPLVAVEHICFGRELLDPEVEVLTELRAHEPSGRPPWPWTPGQARSSGPRQCRRIEHAERWPISRDRSQFTVLAGFARGRAALRNVQTGLEVTIQWDHSRLPAAWLWQEVRASGGVWRHKAELLAFEPASVPHSLGLAQAVARRQALLALPGKVDAYVVALSVRDA